jgi:ribonuclease III
MDKNKIKNYFQNEDLYLQSLTHRSWVNEHKGVRETNERLEFLGDAVLEFIISDHLYRIFPNKEEGYLTALRSNLVNTQSLSEIANDLSIGNDIFLSKGEEDGGGRTNQSLLADTLEAIIGAIFIDNGVDKAREFIKDHIFIKIDEVIKKPLKDAKSRLQEVVQAKSYPAPKYSVVNETGPDHSKEFLVEVHVNSHALSQGTGKSKAEAEQNAAENALHTLHDKPNSL